MGMLLIGRYGWLLESEGLIVRNKSMPKIVIGMLLLAPIALLLMTMVVDAFTMNVNAISRLKRAAGSNTIPVAAQELGAAVKYLETNGITSGFTLFPIPSHDVGFWFQNLRDSLQELQAIRPDASSLEKSNVLMKLRETIMDDGVVTKPPLISQYPIDARSIFLLLVALVAFVTGVYLINDGGGFKSVTLLELIIVLAIFMIAATVAFSAVGL